MAVSIQCPNPACGKVSAGAVELVGRNVRCKHCGRQFVAGATVSLDETRRTESTPVDPFPVLPAKFGRYRVVKLLGKGGMGSVYLAEDTQLQRRVALKLPAFTAGESALRAERFVREARSAAVLQHPNICTVYDAGQVGDRPYITMAFIDGRPLDDRIDPDKPMPEAEAARIARQVALALQEAHDRGIVHRDLKPGNVLMSARGEPVVMDFGLAKKVADSDAEAREAKLTRDGSVLGTPSYMAPEQVRGEVDRIGPRTDVYALGVMLFEMLTGRTPYTGALGVVMGRILAAPVPSVAEFRPDVDPRLDAACRKAMAKDADARFASMTAFAAALDLGATMTPAADPFADLTNAAAAGSATTIPPAPRALAGRSGRRLRWQWPLVAAGAVAVVVVAALLLTPWSKPGGLATNTSDPAGPPVADPHATVLARLKESPDDPAANLARGRFLVARWEWDEAIRHLAKGGDPDWQAAARREQAGLSTGIARREEGDAWWSLSEKLSGAERHAVRARAADRYAGGLAGLAGPERDRLVARILPHRGEPDMTGVKPLFDRDFRDPANTPNCPEASFADGCFVLTGTRRGQATPTPLLFQTPDEFVFQAKARFVPGAIGSWWAQLGMTNGETITVKVDHLRIYVDVAAGKNKVSVPEQAFEIVNSRGNFDWYTLTGVVRGESLELYVNQIKVGPTIKLAKRIGECQLRLALINHGQKGPSKVMWERLTVWPGADVKPFDERRREIVPAPSTVPAKAPVPKVSVVPAADNLRREAIPVETLKFLGRGDPAKVPAELVGVFGSTANRLPEDPCWSAFTPDGKFLVVPSGTTLSFLEWETGKLDRVIQLPGSGRAHRVVISPDGKRFAVHYDPSVVIGELASGRMLTLKDYDLPFASQPFVPDGRGIILLNKRELAEAVCVSTTDGSVLGRPPVSGSREFQNFRPTPDGREFVGLGNKTLTVFSATDFKASRTMATRLTIDKNLGVVFSADGRRLLVNDIEGWEVFEWPSLRPLGSGKGRAHVATFDASGDRVWFTDHHYGEPPVTLWCHEVSTATGREVQKVQLAGNSGWAFWVASPDRKWIAAWSGSDLKRLCRINTVTGAVTAPEIGHTESALALAVSPDGTSVATAGVDRAVRIWDLATGKESACLRVRDQVTHNVWYSADGKLIGWAGNAGRIIVWDASGAEKVNIQTSPHPHTPTFTPDGKAIVAGMEDGRVGFYDTATGALIRTTPKVTNSPRSVIAYSPDGQTLAVGGEEPLVRLVDPTSGVVRREFQTTGIIWFLNFSADGKHLYSTPHAGHPIRGWNIETGAVTDFPLTHRIPGVSLQSGGGLLAMGGNDSFLRFENLAELDRMPVTFRGMFGSRCERIAFTPDGRHLVAAGSNGLVLVFRVPTDPAEISAWFDRKADEAGLPRRKTTYSLDQIKAGQIKAPDLGGRKKLFECDFDAPTKDFPSAGPGKFPRIEGGKHLVDNAAGVVVLKNEKVEFLQTRVAIPGEHPAFALEFVPTLSGGSWSVLVEDGKKVLEVSGLSQIQVSEGQRWTGGRRLTPTRQLNPLRFDKPRPVLVTGRGGVLEVFVDGVAVCDPVYLDEPLSKSKLSIALTGPANSRMELDRVTVWEMSGK